jgi:gluconate 5-dehydrogenase
MASKELVFNMASVLKINLDKKVIAVTGGYGYLGHAICSSLALHGANVLVLARDRDKFNERFKSTKNIEFVDTDVSESSSIVNAFDCIVSSYGKIDTLINNAFFLQGQSPDDMTDEDWNRGMEGVVGSVFKCVRSVIPILKTQGEGAIINVASMYGVVAPDFSIYEQSASFLNPPHYGVAKAGVIQLTRYYASYLGKYGITVNCVSPGPFPSPIVQQDQIFVRKLASKTLLGRIGKPEELAGIFVFLASDAAKYITGQNISVDGGWTAQ